MVFIIKQFDTSLVTFRYIDQGIRGQRCEIIHVNEEKQYLLPIGLELSSDGILSWLKRRIIPKNREFVDILLSKIGLSHGDTIGIIKVCKGLSLTDCYWVVEEDFTGLFHEYNLYDNPFEKMLSLIAYTGYGSIKMHGFTSSPEFTTNGMLKKAWRIQGENRVLYKGGTTGASNTGMEPYSEFYAAQIAQAMEIKHIPYGLAKWKGGLCSTCNLFTSKEISYAPIYYFTKNKPIYEVSEFIKGLGVDFYRDFVNMIVFDCVICNEDRHYGNFGLLIDNKSNQPVCFAPVFDHGLSLFNYAVEEDFKDLDKYAKTRLSSYHISFLDLAKEFIEKEQKAKLRNLIDFTFLKHSTYNLPEYRLQAIEKFLQRRAMELLEL